jgi:SAM-dependent MidA family methyltransferase
MMAGMATGLTDRLLRRIERSGPITFAAFMSDALYDPDEGFYERGPTSAGTDGARATGAGEVGLGGSFVTSPHVSPVFGRLLARQVQDFDAALGRPAPFGLVDVGAGDGTLGEQIAGGIGDDLRARMELVLVERTARHRVLAEARRMPSATRIVAGLNELPAGSIEGCLIANELLDNLPFHLVRSTDGRVVELLVGAGSDGASLVLVDGPVSSDEIGRLAGALPPGQVATIPTGALAFVDAAAAVLRRGYALVVDYAATEDTDEFGGVHGYRGHGVVGDVLAHPGSSDVTAGVDMEVVARHAERAGFRVWGPVTQRDALAVLGFADEVEALRRAQVASLDESRGTEAVRAYSARGAARLLVERGGLGDFAVLCLGKGVGDAPPRCMTPPPEFRAGKGQAT